MLSRRSFIAVGAGFAAAAAMPVPSFAAYATPSIDLSIPFLEGKTMRLWHHVPASAGRSAPVVFVIHGNGRNAEAYFRNWVPLAERYGVVVLAPEFDRHSFPGSREFNQGWVLDGGGARRSPEQWSFSIIDHAFSVATRELGLTRKSYSMFGHSAGAQFVHRFLLLAGAEHVDVAVAANAGWYTLPVAGQAYPFGIDGLGIGDVELGNYFRKPMVLLLGDADTDPNHPQLSREPGAMQQGVHRYARGLHMYEIGKRESQRLGVPLAWRLDTVRDVAHSGGRMSEPAARLISAFTHGTR